MKSLTRIGILLLIISLLFAGCSSQNNTASDQIRIGFFPNITHTQALYGRNTGQYEEAFGDDVTVQWLEFNAGPSEIEAIFAGEVDIGYIGPIPAINAYARSSGDVVIIAGATDAGAILVTRPDLILDSVDDLSGLKVAIPQLGNTQHLSLLHLLQEASLETTDNGGTVEVVATANADIMAMLDQGNIDAALVPEPWGAKMVGEVGANILLDEREVWRDGDYPVALVIVNKDFMDANPELVETFVATHLAITDEINADFEQAKTIINNELEALTGSALSQTVLDAAFSRIRISTTIDQEAIDGFIDILVASGYADPISDSENILQFEILNRVQGDN